MSNNPRNYQLVIGVALSSIMGTMATLPGSYFWWAAAFEFAPKESHYVILIQWLFIPIGGACIAAFAAFYGGRIGLEKLKIRQTFKEFLHLIGSFIDGDISVGSTFCSCCFLEMFAAI